MEHNQNNQLSDNMIDEMLEIIKEITGVENDNWILVHTSNQGTMFYNTEDKMEFIFTPAPNPQKNGKAYFEFSFYKPLMN